MSDKIPPQTDAILDEEATGIDRPGLHAAAGERPKNEHFGEVLARSMQRRSFLLGAAATVPVLMTAKLPGLSGEANAAEGDVASEAGADRLTFKAIQASTEDAILVPESYESDVLVRWGDPLFDGAPEFSAGGQTGESQAQQFGYNCDFVGYFPLEDDKRALLCVNHEYTSGAEMFRNYVAGEKKVQAEVEMAAHGGSVVEIKKSGGRWSMATS